MFRAMLLLNVRISLLESTFLGRHHGVEVLAEMIDS